MEVTVAYFTVPLQHLPEGAEKTMKDLSQDTWLCDQEIKLGILQMQVSASYLRQFYNFVCSVV